VAGDPAAPAAEDPATSEAPDAVGAACGSGVAAACGVAEREELGNAVVEVGAEDPEGVRRAGESPPRDGCEADRAEVDAGVRCAAPLLSVAVAGEAGARSEEISSDPEADLGRESAWDPVLLLFSPEVSD
jgi:hypothetical protein